MAQQPATRRPRQQRSDKPRDAGGLTREQRLVLLHLAQGDTLTDSAKAAGISRELVYKWKREEAAFANEYTKLFSGITDDSRLRLEGATSRATDVFIEGMGATKDTTLEVECPECHTEFSVVARVPDHKTRLHAGELVQRSAKVLKDVQEVQGSVVVLSIGERIALALYQSGEHEKIPAPMWARLREAGAIPPPEATQSEEATWYEVDQSDEPQPSGDGVQSEDEGLGGAVPS